MGSGAKGFFSYSAYLKRQLVGGLSRVTLGDVRSCNSRNVDGGLLGHQQMVPLVVDLVKEHFILLLGCRRWDEGQMLRFNSCTLTPQCQQV